MKLDQRTLPNGVRIVTDTMDSVETVSLGAWVSVGTRYERSDINGVSHLLEHMAFKGTKRRTARGIAEEIEAVGGTVNAYTSRELTVYYATVLKGDEAVAIDIIGDILQNSVFDEAELTRERAVVLQEIGQANDTPDDIIFDMYQARAFPDQPMGRPVLGEAEIVGAMPRRALIEYMAEHYGGKRLVLAASGNLEPERIMDLAAANFGNVVANGAVAYEPARYEGGDVREKRDLEQVHIVLGFEAFRYGDPDYYALSVLSTLLGGGMSSRLFQEIREKRGLVYSIYSFFSPFVDTGTFGVYAGTGEKEVAELIPVLCDEICKVMNGITEDEMKRARAQMRAGLLMGLESTQTRAEQIARHTTLFDRVIPIEELRARIDEVDADAVRRAARRVFASRPTFAALGPIDHVEPFERIAQRIRV